MSTNGKKPVKDSKGNIVKNLYQKNNKNSGSDPLATKLSKLKEMLNNKPGISVSQNVSKNTLKGVANAISKTIAIPLTGAKTQRNKD